MALVIKNPPANAGDIRDSGLIPGLGRSPGGRKGSPVQYSCLGNLMDRGAWWAAVYGVAQSWTRLSDLAAAAAVLSEVPLPTIHPRVVAHNSLRPNVFF